MAKHIEKLNIGRDRLGNSINWEIEFTEGKLNLYHKDNLKLSKDGFKLDDIVIVDVNNFDKITVRKLYAPKNKIFKLFWSYGFNKGHRVNSLEEIEDYDKFWGIECIYDEKSGYLNGTRYNPSNAKSLIVYAPDNERILAVVRSGRSYWGDRWRQAYYIAPNINNAELEIISNELAKSKFNKVWYAEDLD